MLASPTLPASAPRRSAGAITLTVLQFLLAAAFIWGGVNKLGGFQQDAEISANFAKFGFGPGFRYFVATLELLGGVGLLIPRLTGLAALCLAGVMVGAVLAHILVLPPVAVALVPGTIAVLLSLIARAHWADVAVLFRRS